MRAVHRLWAESCVRSRYLHCSVAVNGLEELLPRGDEQSDIYTGRSWTASELRLKSFKVWESLWIRLCFGITESCPLFQGIASTLVCFVKGEESTLFGEGCENV